MSDIMYDGKIYEHLSVDVSQPNMFAPPLVKEGDSGTRGFIITVTDNGEPIAIPTTATVWLNCSNTADAEKHASAAGTINSDGTVTVDVPTVVMEVPGLIECDVSIITLSGADETEILKSTLFCLQCERAANKDGTSTKAEDSILAGIASGEIEVPGASGPQGPAGPAGPQGSAGADGFSPSATVTKSGDTATITITDKNGTTTTTIKDGSGVRIITPEESAGWDDEIPLTFAGELYDIAGWNDKLWVLNQIAATPGGGTNYFWEPLISAYDFDTALETKENTANKTSAITAANKASTTQYTTPKAVADYTGAMLGSNCVTPQMYGAKANGTANDTAAINAAIAAADTVWFPQGVYLIDGCPASASSTQSGIIVPSGKTLVFHENAVLLKKPTLIKEDVLRLAPGAENVRIFGGVIRGDRSYKLQNLSAEQFHSYNGSSTGILMRGCKNIIVEDTRVEDICGDGIALVYDEDGNCCEDITIRRCTIDRSWRNGIWVGRALRVFIERCHMTNTGCAEDENGLAIVRDELAYDANLISRSIITEGDGTLHGCLPRCGIDIESEARYSGEPLFSNEYVYIRDSVFIGNDGDDIIMTNPCDHIYISGNRCEKRITSARNTPTDEIVISNSSLKDVNLHGERLVNCTVTGVVYAFKTGSRFENCDINSLEINASTDEEHTHYLSHCTIHSIESYGVDKSTVLFQGCTFLFSAGAQTAFGGKKMVLNNCDVIFDALYNPASTPLNVLRDFQAVNTTFKMLDSDNAHTLESFFKANSSGGSVTLEGCVLDLWPKVKNILNANIGAATVVNCAVINHNSVGALEGSGYIIHGNVYKNNPLVIPTKTSDLENDSGFLTQHQDISGKVDKTRKIAGVDLQDDITAAELKTALNVPTVPTNVSAFTNDANYLTLATLPIYNGGVQ